MAGLPGLVVLRRQVACPRKKNGHFALLVSWGTFHQCCNETRCNLRGRHTAWMFRHTVFMAVRGWFLLTKEWDGQKTWAPLRLSAFWS